MKIINRTKWSTDDLRFMIGQAFRDHGVPSQGMRVIVTFARSGIPSGTADPGKYKGKFTRITGVMMRRAGADISYGQALRVRIPNPRRDFAPESEEHVGLVVDVARMFDACAIILAAGAPSKLWRDKPIAWLSDWFEVHRGEKGRAIGSRVSPLLPEPPPDRSGFRERKLLHAKAMLKKTLTRIKRAETSAKMWRRRVAALERKES